MNSNDEILILPDVKERARIRSRQWHRDNVEKSRVNSRKYYINNSERLKEAQKLRRASDPEYHRKHEQIRRLKYTEKFMWQRARKRAFNKKLEFNIEISDIIIPVFCPVYPHIRLESGPDKDTSPSLDRINNDLGYIKNNVRVISYRANRHKSDMSIDELKLQVKNLE